MNRLQDAALLDRLPAELQRKLEIDRLKKRLEKLRRRRSAIHERMAESLRIEMALRRRGAAPDLCAAMGFRERRRHDRWHQLHGLAEAVAELLWGLESQRHGDGGC